MMVVKNILSQTAYKLSENVAAPVKIGDVSSIVIKEKTGANEAKVVLKGQELTVQFDGPVPTEDRALVEITRQNENGQWIVKPIVHSQPQTAVNQVDNLLKKAGFDPSSSSELKEAVNGILSRGGWVSIDIIENLQVFLKIDVGTLAEKLDTIKVMQQKRIEFTKIQLNAIHLALHGKPLFESISIESLDVADHVSVSQKTSLERVIDPSGKINVEAVEQVLSALDPSQDNQEITDIKKALQIIAAGKERISQSLHDSDLKQMVEQESNLTDIIKILKRAGVPENQAIHDARKLEKIGTARIEETLNGILNAEDPADEEQDTLLKSITKLVQKETDLAKLLPSIQILLGETDESIKSTLEKATELTKQGRELAARRELATAMNRLEELYPKKDEIPLSKAERYYVNDAVQSLSLKSQNVLVTEITKKLSQMAIDFKKVRQEMSRNLDSVSRIMEANKPVVPVKQMIEATIKKLDNTILKGDFMLYTDMTQEKELLSSSSKLAEARNLLNKGNVGEASRIVKEVKSVLDKLIFKPAVNKVMHFASDQELPTPKSMLEKALEPSAGREQGARQIFEKIKALGLTHETDVAQEIMDKQESSHNLKSVLLREHANFEQAVATITGQQLLNKPDASGLQNLFLQLPILLNKQVENVKIYVNSQKQGEKIDWENCSLYFVLETKKLGDVGILISASNRNLAITVKNNRDGLEERMRPLVEVAKGRLEEIGYNVGSIQFRPFSEASVELEKPAALTPAFTEKGYDFSI